MLATVSLACGIHVSMVQKASLQSLKPSLHTHLFLYSAYMKKMKDSVHSRARWQRLMSLLKIQRICVYVCVCLCACTCIYTCVPHACSALGGQKRALQPMELVLEELVNCRVGAGNLEELLNTKPSLQPDVCTALHSKS